MPTLQKSSRTRRPIVPVPTPDRIVSHDESRSQPDTPPAQPAAILKPRIGVPLTANESAIDWDSMRESTRGKLLAMLRTDPRVASVAATSGPAPEIFSDAWCGVIFDAMGKLEASIVQRVYHVTPEQAAIMLLSEPEKAMLSGPFRKVLNKYAGSWLTVYQDEAALLLALGGLHIAKLQALRAALEQPRPVVDWDDQRKDA